MGRGEGEEGGGKEGIPEVKHRRKRVFINICSDFRSPVITKSGGGEFCFLFCSEVLRQKR